MQARYAARANGLQGVVITNLDVLSGFARLPVAVAYRLPDGRVVEDWPAELGCSALDAVEPVYEELPGWDEDLTAARSLDDLPKAARAYVDFLAERLGVPIVSLSVGPGREQMFDTDPAVPWTWS